MSQAPPEVWLRKSHIGRYYETHYDDEPDVVRYVRADLYEALQAVNERMERNYAALLASAQQEPQQEPRGELGADYPR